MRSQCSDCRALLRIGIGIGIGCGNDDDPEPAAILATGGSIAVVRASPSLSRSVRKSGISRWTWASRPMSRSAAPDARTGLPSPARGGNISRRCGPSGATHAALHLPSRSPVERGARLRGEQAARGRACALYRQTVAERPEQRGGTGLGAHTVARAPRSTSIRASAPRAGPP